MVFFILTVQFFYMENYGIYIEHMNLLRAKVCLIKILKYWDIAILKTWKKQQKTMNKLEIPMKKLIFIKFSVACHM